jgi:hypothetical protein
MVMQKIKSWKCPVSKCRSKWKGVFSARCPKHQIMMVEK